MPDFSDTLKELSEELKIRENDLYILPGERDKTSIYVENTDPKNIELANYVKERILDIRSPVIRGKNASAKIAALALIGGVISGGAITYFLLKEKTAEPIEQTDVKLSDLVDMTSIEEKIDPEELERLKNLDLDELPDEFLSVLLENSNFREELNRINSDYISLEEKNNRLDKSLAEKDNIIDNLSKKYENLEKSYTSLLKTSDNDDLDDEAERELLEKYPILRFFRVGPNEYDTIDEYINIVKDVNNITAYNLLDKVGKPYIFTDADKDIISNFLVTEAKKVKEIDFFHYRELAKKLGLDENSYIGFGDAQHKRGKFRMPDPGVDPIVRVKTIGVASFTDPYTLENYLISEILEQHKDWIIGPNENIIYGTETDSTGNIIRKVLKFEVNGNYVIQLDKYGDDSKIVGIGWSLLDPTVGGITSLDPCNICQKYPIIWEIKLNRVPSCLCLDVLGVDYYLDLVNKYDDPDGDGLLTIEEELLGTSPINEDTDEDDKNDKNDPYPLEHER